MNQKTLRRIYDASFEGGLYGSAASRLKITFDEYFEFLQKLSPLATRRSAAENAMRGEFRKLAKRFPPDPPDAEVDPSQHNHAWFERKPAIDLAKLKIDLKTESLSLDRVKRVRG